MWQYLFLLEIKCVSRVRTQIMHWQIKVILDLVMSVHQLIMCMVTLWVSSMVITLKTNSHWQMIMHSVVCLMVVMLCQQRILFYQQCHWPSIVIGHCLLTVLIWQLHQQNYLLQQLLKVVTGLCSVQIHYWHLYLQFFLQPQCRRSVIMVCSMVVHL